MKRCKNCKILFSTYDDSCPLCHHHSSIKEGEDDYAYPYIPMRFSGDLAIKILIFISVIVAVVMFAIGYLTKTSLKVPLYTLLAIGTIWTVLYSIVQKRRSIIKSFLYQMFIFSLLFIVWDFYTGYKGWAISYVIPILNISVQIAMLIAAKVIKERPSDYLIYLLMAALTGLLPTFFLLFKVTTNPFLSVLCVSFSIIIFAALLIFYGNLIFDEIKKKMSM